MPKRTKIVNPHYQFLKKHNRERWNLLNAELAREGYTETFKRTILRNEKKRLIDFQSWVRTCIIKYMPWFSNEHFDSNTWPELPPVASLKADTSKVDSVSSE